MSAIKRAEAEFAAETAGHHLTILRDDGLYRHLRCRKPGTSIWGWDIITWPGHLATAGDLGSYVFCRSDDMIGFFTGKVNPCYWLEKCVAWDGRAHAQGVVSLHLIEDRCESLSGAVRERLEGLDGTGQVGEAIRILIYDADEPDAWDWTITEPDHHALRILHAIAWACAEYRRRQS